MELTPLDDLDSMPLTELHKANNYVHLLHDYISAYTYYRKYAEEKNIELAEAYKHFSDRLKKNLPDIWKTP